MRKILLLLGIVVIVVVRGVQYLNSNSIDTITINESSAHQIKVTITQDHYFYNNKGFSLEELSFTLQKDCPPPAQLEIYYSFSSEPDSSKLSALSLALLKAKYKVSLKTQ